MSEETKEEMKARLTNALDKCLTAIGKIVTYLTTTSKRGIEVTFLTHVWRMLSIYVEYVSANKPEAYLQMMYERERREFYSTRAMGDLKIEKDEAYTADQRRVQSCAKQLFDVRAAPPQCDELLEKAGSCDRAIEFMEWLANRPDEYLKDKRIYSFKFVLGCWKRFEDGSADDGEVQRLAALEKKADRARAGR